MFEVRKMLRWVLLLVLILVSNGCVVKQIGYTVKHTIKADYFLSTEEYSRGKNSFREEVEKDPNSASANYYYGRFLLAENKYSDGLTYLRKASSLDADNADYHFWTGVAHGSLGQKNKERKRYKKTLALKKDHLQALIYMGHNRFEAGKYESALNLYAQALKLWPSSPSSLYSRALIMTKLKRKPEAVDAWLEYLYYYPSGKMARNGVRQLNELDNFSYRNFPIHSRIITIGKIYFEPFSAEIARGSRSSLDLVGAVYEGFKKKGKVRGAKLHIVVYQLNNKKLAKEKAKNVKKYLLENFKDLKSKDIGISWFETAEKFRKNKGVRRVDDSVVFFVSR